MTVDLLLSLGNKLSDVLLLLLNKRLDQTQKAEAQQLIDQYKRLQECYQQLRMVVEQYNHAIENIFTAGNLEAIYPFCTYEQYQNITRFYYTAQEHQISYQKLDILEILSVDLTTQVTETENSFTSSVVNTQYATVYARESWVTFYQNGSQNKQSVVNVYHLRYVEDAWKVANLEVFVPSKL